ncbi:helix-turn-helix domain-containing protein, partial [Chondromyces apiculatus]|uniref:helix-turn-helix domain-containing protein n=1 Tax=Chondromyces apiculatus TaxID=51 RepID=UPI0012DE1FA6
MSVSREQLAGLVKSHRDRAQLTQAALAESVGTSRSTIALLEQAVRLPRGDTLSAVCNHLGIPGVFWEEYADEAARQRLEFEELLSELTGRPLSLVQLPDVSKKACDTLISALLTGSRPNNQTRDLFNSILIYYGQPPVSGSFFERYLGARAFSSIEAFERSIESYQIEAIRLFSTLSEAYRVLATTTHLAEHLAPLSRTDVKHYTDRSEWTVIEQIPNRRLPDLGYISATRIRQEERERQALRTFLERLAASIRGNSTTVALSQESEGTKRRMDSLLRRFGSSLEHGLFSPLFRPDPDALEREAQRLAPTTDAELARIADTQEIAQRNLSHYLSADHIDVYVATSMRSDADFVSVNVFATSLFSHPKVRPFKLRYFNPTQSWVDDRIGKGLVEALMLRRSSVTIYMAQKLDSFGKDSEASVALGQGKPVIVYVPKLVLKSHKFDSETLFAKSRPELVAQLRSMSPALAEDVDDSLDDEALVSRILTSALGTLDSTDLCELVRGHAADFELEAEDTRLVPDKREGYRRWLKEVATQTSTVAAPAELEQDIRSILVAVGIRLERRAQLFREIHPLALQVILSSGVLNGILVVRSVDRNRCTDPTFG